MAGKEKTILIMIIGLMFSAFIIFAGSRSMFIDQMAINWGVEVWEIAFTVYFVSFMIAVTHDIITDKGRFDTHDFGDIIMVSLMSVFSYLALSVMSVGSLAVGIGLMQTENVEWSLMYGLVIAVYLVAKMVKR